jgi:hypothetical protein
MKIKEIFIADEEHSDLDMGEPFYPSSDPDEPNDIEYMNRGVLSESPAVSITKVIELFTKMRAEGATHVYIGDHCDHHGYEYSFVKYEPQYEKV